MAAFIKKAQRIAAGPLMVIDTEVFGSAKLKPEYNFLAASKLQKLTPEFQIFP
jgi:hypothetical protein